MKKFISLALAFTMTFCCGCSGNGNVHDKNYVRALAVAGENGKAAVFSFYDEKTEPFASIGENLDDIRSETELNTGKALFTGHTMLIILGDCDYLDTLETLLTEWKVSPSCKVIYAGPYAAHALKNLDAEVLSDAVEKAVEQGKAPKCDIITVLSGLLSDNRSANVAKIDENGISGSYTIK